MRSKLSLHALAFAGIIAVSGLPAFAAEMTPATPAPGASVQSDSKAGVSGAGNAASTAVNAKVDAKAVPSNPKDSKDLHKAAATDTKNAGKDIKAAKDKKPVQTAKLPAAAPAPSVPAPTPTVNGSAGTAVQH